MPLNIGYLTAGRTPESDECLTPRYVVEPIIKYLKAKKFKKIWCPFDKADSFYVRLLKEEGFFVMFSHKDINDGDFLKMNMTFLDIDFDCIVSNPPFSKKDEILKKLYKIGKPFALLLPIQTLQSKKRTPLFMKYGLELLSFDKRACFYTNNNLDAIKFGNHFASAYFCNGVLPSNLIFETLEEKQEPYKKDESEE